MSNLNNKIYTVKEITEKLQPVFVNSPVKKAILFGSYAQGAAHLNSDIDIFIDSNGELNGLNFFGIYEEIKTVLQKPIDLIEKIDVAENTKITQAIANGVVIYE